MSEVKDAPKVDFAKMDGSGSWHCAGREDERAADALAFLEWETSEAQDAGVGFRHLLSRTRQKLSMKGGDQR